MKNLYFCKTNALPKTGGLFFKIFIYSLLATALGVRRRIAVSGIHGKFEAQGLRIYSKNI